MWCEYLSVRCSWLCHFIMSHTCLERIYTLKLLECQENPWSRRRSIWKLSGGYKTQTHNRLVSKHTLNHLVKFSKWLSRVMNITCMMHLTVWFYHVRYVFRLNLQFVIAWMLRSYLTKTEAKSLSVCLQTKKVQGGFKSCCKHLPLTFRYGTQEVPWHSSNYRMYIHY